MSIPANVEDQLYRRGHQSLHTSLCDLDDNPEALEDRRIEGKRDPKKTNRGPEKGEKVKQNGTLASRFFCIEIDSQCAIGCYAGTTRLLCRLSLTPQPSARRPFTSSRLSPLISG